MFSQRERFAGLAVACSFALVGCPEPNRKPADEVRFDPEKFTDELENFVAAFPDCEPIFKKDVPSPEDEFRVSVFVDQSQSIQAFVPTSPTPEFFEQSNFVDLLRSFAHQAETDVFIGFGTGSDGEIREDYGRTPPLTKGSYALLNNDYAKVISEFQQQMSEDQIFVVVTDGVQSHPDSKDGSLMGATASAIKEWVGQGGYVDLRVLTAPLDGKYFSEELRARGQQYTLYVTEQERPFLVMAFIPDKDLLDDWDIFLARERLAELTWAATYRLPQFEEETAPPVEPFPAKLSGEESQDLGLVPQTNRPYGEFKHLKELDAPWSDSIWWSKIESKALRKMDLQLIDQLPIYLDVSHYNKNEGAENFEFDQDAFNRWKPRLQIYRKDAGEEGLEEEANSGPSSEKGQSEGEADSSQEAGVEWRLVEERDLRFEKFPLVSPEPAGPSGEEAAVPCLRIMIPWGVTSETLVVFRQDPAEGLLDEPDFREWSTLDDSSQEQMKKVYNLQTLMEQVTKGGQKIGHPQGFGLLLVPTQLNRF